MKKLFFAVLWAVLYGNIVNAQTLTLSDSLLLYYSFDNGEVIDFSGNNFDGTVFEAVPTTDRNGNTNSAYQLDGINDYIDLPNDAKLKPELPISFAMWVKFDQLDQTLSEVFTTDFVDNNYTGVWVCLSNSGTIAIAYGDNTGNTSSTNRRTKIGTTSLNVGEWYHVVGVIRGATDMDIYINCVDDGGTYAGTGGNLGYSSNPGSIGRKDAHMSNPNYWFKGSIDELGYWNRALTAQDVQELCNGSICTSTLYDTTHVTVYDTTHVVVYDTQYVAVTDTLLMDVLLSVSGNPVMNRIKVFPNPSNDVVVVDNGDYGNMTNYSLKIFNSLGQEVFNSTINTQQFNIPVNTLGDTGTYFIKLYDSSDNLIDTRKLILY